MKSGWKQIIATLWLLILGVSLVATMVWGLIWLILHHWEETWPALVIGAVIFLTMWSLNALDDSPEVL